MFPTGYFWMGLTFESAKFSMADFPPQCGSGSSNTRRAWREEKGKDGRILSLILTTELGHGSPALRLGLVPSLLVLRALD